jgi:outer membrane protein assembly factor BamB
VYCPDAKTGAQIYGGERIAPGTYSSSPTLAGGNIFITSEDGVTAVIMAGPEFEVLAENNMNDHCLSTISVYGGNCFCEPRRRYGASEKWGSAALPKP